MIVLNVCFNLFIIKKLIKLFYLLCSCKKAVGKSNKENLKWSKILCQINQEIWKTRKIIGAVGKLFNQCAHNWRGFAEGVLKVVFFTVLCFKWSVKKHCVAKILQGIWERFLYENNRNYNSYKFSYKFDFIPVLSFRRNQKQESNFQQVGDLVTRNISVFCL